MMFKNVWAGLVLGLAALVIIGVSMSSCSSTSTTATTVPAYATGTVSGVVTTATGTAVANAVVNTFNGSTIVSGTTNASGAYTLSGVWIGVHVLIISSSNYSAVSTVAVTDGGTTTQNISADAGTAATTAPVVTLTSVSTQTASEFFTVAGTLTPTSGINNVVVSVNNNDSLASVSSGSFSKVIHLVSGTNTIVVTAFNSQGYNQQTLTVTYTPASVQTGSVKITLNWDKASDMDLHLWNKTGDRHTYYSRHYGGPLSSISVEVVTVSGSLTTVNYPKDTSVNALLNTLLDYDNIGGTGPENMTIFSDGLTAGTAEVRYLVGVNSFSASYPVTCSLSVKLPDGTTHAYTQA
ncbi:MAG TPA: carboxypeptidase-like regulatory domain-containing protein, partial [Candidatus Sulfotelmatobacter sp.]|nr:carboxypeptidase-like regulatory domain-containing protein [Candidatus Sulfotelmatobacter sp.]